MQHCLSIQCARCWLPHCAFCWQCRACSSLNVGACIADAPSWVLTVHGGLLDPAQASQLPPLGFQPQPADAFQWFVRKLTVQLDPALCPGPEGVIQWEKAQHVGEWRDKFEIR